ncbi:MAG TPA: c-type cytochrome [Candidatus Limnocylindrales bacterium]|nr:c-type cytochrome [Candidatus Limnocylindrales bacterium]
MSQQPPERNDDQNILAITVLFGIVIALMFLVFANQPVKETPPDVAAAQTAAAQPTVVAVVPTAETVVEVPADHPAEYTEAQVQAGTQIFNGLCVACHGSGGVGVAGLGKPLAGSEFVGGLTDDELVQFIIVGRQPTDPLNTTGQLMPARGGNPMLTDGDLYNVVAYIRSLNGAQVGGAAGGETTAANPTPQTVATATAPEDWVAPPLNALDASVVAPGTLNTGTLDVTNTTDGAQLNAWYCQSCHGPAGEGVNGQAALVGMDVDYDLFVQMITMAAPPGNPDAGFVHPYRGGTPGMSDAQIDALVAYLQGLGS